MLQWSKAIAECPVKKEDLPETLRVNAKVIQQARRNSWHQMPPKVFYGFGLNHADCLDYYLACDAIPDQPEDMTITAPVIVSMLMHLVEGHLSKICDHDFFMILPKSNDYLVPTSIGAVQQP